MGERTKTKHSSKTMMKMKLHEMIDYAIGGAERGEINIHALRKFFNFILEKTGISREIAFIEPETTILNEAERVQKNQPEPENTEIKSLVRPVILNPNHGSQETNKFEDTRIFSLCGLDRSLELSCISIGSLFRGVKEMEQNTLEVEELPEQYDLLRSVNPYESMTPTILTEAWKMLKTIRQIFKNEAELSEANLRFEQYKLKMAELKEFNDEIRKGVKELNKGNVDDTGRPITTDPFQAVVRLI
ncbi:hypothetical protein HELRODRAFT_175215 [Helobdella robusta]|uniref:Uncharacterized protein n=1 Tax=Helobdella robusta TaxID=6412 RepID=T1F910_HELRO|nr:hypothetical protein HELRODRAFT_175215 [Helobdella robusta]ESO01187.1 hypothetical protein HELRODRAFT_175215 [Helobdella robusta]